MATRIYRISQLESTWVVEQDNLTMRSSTQASAIEMAMTAAKYDGQHGYDTRIVLCASPGLWSQLWAGDG